MLQQKQDAAHRRYVSAIKTLATVRKLLTPSRSPVEIASKLAGERSGLRLRQAPEEKEKVKASAAGLRPAVDAAEGVPLLNCSWASSTTSCP